MRKAVDVVLCDVKLPDGNGVDFVKEVKAKFSLPEIVSPTLLPPAVQGVAYKPSAPVPAAQKFTDLWIWRCAGAVCRIKLPGLLARTWF